MLIQVSLRAVHKEICKKKKKSRDADLTEISLGVILSLSHTHIGLP